MQTKKIKRYQTEIIFILISIGLLVTGYMVFLQYTTYVEAEEKLGNLKKELQQTKHQVAKLSPVTVTEKEEWKQLKEQFMKLYPPPIDLPNSYTYDAINKEFYGSGMPLSVTEIPLYQAINQATDAAAIPKITISRQKNSNHPEAEVNRFLVGQGLKFEFVSQYQNVLQFIWELHRLPLVLEVTSLTMTTDTKTPLNRHQQELGVEMMVQYFYRKSEQVFEG